MLQTERLRFRPFTLDDAEFALELLNEDGFLRYIGDKQVRTLDDARNYLSNGPLASYTKYGVGMYLVTLRGKPTAIGMCGLIRRDILEEFDLGYAFLDKYSGNGFATESAQAALEHAHKQLQLKQILAITNTDNAASIAVLSKLGFSFDRLLQLADDSKVVNVYRKKF